jgi:hypothetical protein
MKRGVYVKSHILEKPLGFSKYVTFYKKIIVGRKTKLNRLVKGFNCL